MREVVDYLIKNNKTISTMENCTGGVFANRIKLFDEGEKVLLFSALNYSNNNKMKLGLGKDELEMYSVYSEATAKEMSKKIADFAGSNYGVGITGKISKIDENNPYGDDSEVYVSIYDKDKNEYYTSYLLAEGETNEQVEEVITCFVDLFNGKVMK